LNPGTAVYVRGMLLLPHLDFVLEKNKGNSIPPWLLPEGSSLPVAPTEGGGKEKGGNGGKDAETSPPPRQLKAVALTVYSRRRRARDKIERREGRKGRAKRRTRWDKPYRDWRESACCEVM